MDPIELVRDSYDAIAEAYLADRQSAGGDIDLLPEFERRLRPNARVLDLGCGAGVPIAARLAENFQVVGIDLSPSQVALARQNASEARFEVADMTASDLGACVFEGVVSFYAIIHVPREHHQAILAKVARALVPGGIALLCLGAEDIPRDETDDYFGRPMFWSHFDAQTYLEMLPNAGFEVIERWLVPDGSYPDAKHLFVLAQRPFES